MSEHPDHVGMNVMTPTGGFGLTEILIHAGYMLTAAAFLLRDILWLRLLAIAANLCVGLAAYRAGMDPHWVVVVWTAIFVAINLGHSCWLIYERHLQRRTDEEQGLYDCCFQALDRVSVRKLLRRGEWVDLAAKDCLARHGIHLDWLLLSSGESAVLLGGKFVGEISFLSGDISTAMVVDPNRRAPAWPSTISTRRAPSSRSAGATERGLRQVNSCQIRPVLRNFLIFQLPKTVWGAV